jgi:hypothetical protein
MVQRTNRQVRLRGPGKGEFRQREDYEVRSLVAEASMPQGIGIKSTLTQSSTF